jgi:hypothetical protein
VLDITKPTLQCNNNKIIQLCNNNIRYYKYLLNKYDIIIHVAYEKHYVEYNGYKKLKINETHLYYRYNNIMKSMYTINKENFRSVNPYLFKFQYYKPQVLWFYYLKKNVFGYIKLDKEANINKCLPCHTLRHIRDSLGAEQQKEKQGRLLPIQFKGIDLSNLKILNLDADLTSIRLLTTRSAKLSLYATNRTNLAEIRKYHVARIVYYNTVTIGVQNSLFLNKYKLRTVKGLIRYTKKVRYQYYELQNIIFYEGHYADPVLKTILLFKALSENDKLYIMESNLAKRQKYIKLFMRVIVNTIKVLRYKDMDLHF